MDRRTEILERARLLADFPSQCIPEASPEIIRQADMIAEGHVFFYEVTPVKVGLEGVDWTGGQIAHQEWGAQLNRFLHLLLLASAYRKTGDEKYPGAARSYIEDWIDFNSGFLSRGELNPGDNTLNLCIRLGSGIQSGWGGTLPVFLGSPSFDDAFLEKMLESVAVQADYLARHLSPRGNWRIAHLDGLVFTALRFPFLPNSEEILRVGLRGMRNALASQFLPDGVHEERTPGYAAWMTRVAANYLRLVSIFPETDVFVDRERFVRAVDYMTRNTLCGFNDATAPHRDPDGNPLEERARLLEFAGMEKEAAGTPPLDEVFPYAGQVFMRSGWEPGSDYLAFDASTWGGGHCHLSRLAFTFRSGGRMLIADPGILNYEMSDPFAPFGKSTRAHATLNLDGMNQSGADASLHRVEFTPGLSLVHASYEGGYWPGRFEWRFVEGRGRGLYARHERVLLWVKEEYILVLDLMDETHPDSTVYSCWPMGPMDGWEMDPDRLEWWSKNPDVNLFLKMLVPDEGVEADCVEGGEEPIRGWVGRRGNDHVPAPHVEFRFPAVRTRNVSVVLAAAFKGAEPPRYEAVSFRSAGMENLFHLEVKRPDGGRDFISWGRRLEPPMDDGEPFVSDSPLVWVRLDAGGAARKCFVASGSYLEMEGRVLFDRKGDRGTYWVEL